MKRCLRALSCGKRGKKEKEEESKKEERQRLREGRPEVSVRTGSPVTEGSPRFRYHSRNSGSSAPVSGSVKGFHIGPVPSPSRRGVSGSGSGMGMGMSRSTPTLSGPSPAPAPSSVLQQHQSRTGSYETYISRKDALVKELREAAASIPPPSSASLIARSVSRARSSTPVLTPRNPDQAAAPASIPSATMPSISPPQAVQPTIRQPSQLRARSSSKEKLAPAAVNDEDGPGYTDVLDELLKKRASQPHRFIDTDKNAITTIGCKGAVPPPAAHMRKPTPPPPAAPPSQVPGKPLGIPPPPPPPQMDKILAEIQAHGASNLKPMKEASVSPIWELQSTRSASPVGCPSTSLPRTSHQAALMELVSPNDNRQSIQRISLESNRSQEVRRSEPPAMLAEAWRGPSAVWRDGSVSLPPQDAHNTTHETHVTRETEETQEVELSSGSPLVLDDSPQHNCSLSTSSIPPFVVAAGVSPAATHQPSCIPPAVPTEVVTLRLDHGDEYKGTVKAGVPHGKGVMRYTNGNSYEGDLKEGLKWGRGVFSWRNGDCYKGEFVKDVFHGHGTFTFSNSTQTYTGAFRNGIFIGPMPGADGTTRATSSDPGAPPSQAPSPSVHYPFYHRSVTPGDEDRGVIQLDVSAPDADGLAPYWPDLPWSEANDEKPKGSRGIYNTLHSTPQAP